MVKRSRKTFSKELRDKVVDLYLSGSKSAEELALEFETDVQNVYRWKTLREQKTKDFQFNQLIDTGSTYAEAKKIMELQLELDEYKKKLAQEVIINELLKKLIQSKTSQPESELTGLIRTTHQLDQKRKRVK
jgi:transposase-like protein